MLHSCFWALQLRWPPKVLFLLAVTILIRQQSASHRHTHKWRLFFLFYSLFGATLEERGQKAVMVQNETVSSSLSLFSHLRWIKAFHWRKTANVTCTTADYWSRISITWEWTKFISNDLSVPTITSLQFSKLSFAVQLLTYVIIFFSLPQG